MNEYLSDTLESPIEFLLLGGGRWVSAVVLSMSNPTSVEVDVVFWVDGIGAKIKTKHERNFNNQY